MKRQRTKRGENHLPSCVHVHVAVCWCNTADLCFVYIQMPSSSSSSSEPVKKSSFCRGKARTEPTDTALSGHTHYISPLTPSEWWNSPHRDSSFFVAGRNFFSLPLILTEVNRLYSGMWNASPRFLTGRRACVCFCCYPEFFALIGSRTCHSFSVWASVFCSGGCTTRD